MDQNLKPLMYFDEERIPQKCYAIYDREKNPNYLRLQEGKYWPSKLDGQVRNFDDKILNPPYHFFFSVKAKSEHIFAYDCLPNTGTGLLVNERVLKILQDLCPRDFQPLDTIIYTRDIPIKNYKLLNVLQLVDAIDMKKSRCEFYEDGELKNVRNLFFKPDCMGDIHLARESQLNSMEIVSPSLAKIFKKERIKGPCFMQDWEYPFNEIFPEDYLTSMYPIDPEAAKRYFVMNLNNEYEFFKTRLSKIPKEIILALINMTLSRSSFHLKECNELLELLQSDKTINP